MYTPPFEITSRIIDLVSQISEKIGEINFLMSDSRPITLRKENRIKTIHSSLAIENNSLTVEQITAIMDGKRVLGSPGEIQEVKNAIETYDILLSLNPYDENDLLKAHRILMQDLVKDNGRYRSGEVGIFDGDKVVHAGPPAKRVPMLMSDLFEWLSKSDVHPLIKSCVFHYEFEFIHPFADGNGRMGRLWQTAILKNWREVFAWLPVEVLIKENQASYYKALSMSDISASSTYFIEFLLQLLLDTIEETLETEKKVTVKVTAKVTANQKKIIECLRTNPYITMDELSEKVGISRKSIAANIKKLKTLGYISRIGADKNGYWQVEEM